MSKDLNNKFNEFITNHSPIQVSRHLRDLLLGYIAKQINAEGLPVDFHIYIWELSGLFDLLDYAADNERDKVGR